MLFGDEEEKEEKNNKTSQLKLKPNVMCCGNVYAKRFDIKSQ